MVAAKETPSGKASQRLTHKRTENRLSASWSLLVAASTNTELQGPTPKANIHASLGHMYSPHNLKGHLQHHRHWRLHADEY